MASQKSLCKQMMHFEVSQRAGRGGHSLSPWLWGIFQDLWDHCGVQAGAISVSQPLGECCKEKAGDRGWSQDHPGRQWLLQKQKDTSFGTDYSPILLEVTDTTKIPSRSVRTMEVSQSWNTMIIFRHRRLADRAGVASGDVTSESQAYKLTKQKKTFTTKTVN